MKRNKNLLAPIIAFGIMAIIIALMLIIYFNFVAKGVQGSKEIVVEVVIPDEESKDFKLQTDAEYLRQALDEANLIKGSDSSAGFFVTEVNGRAADSAKQEWWCITKDGADVYTGVDQTPIKDGDHYELTLKIGY